MAARDIVITEGWRPGALGAIITLHAEYYAREWGFGPVFEAKNARELANFMQGYDHDRDRLYLALDGEEIVGSLVIDGGGQSATAAGPRLRWFFLSETCRGLGLGRRLMDEAMRFVESRSNRCHLTTFAGLDAARALYERAGFRLVEEVVADSWGTRVTEQRFEWTRPA